MVRVQELYKTQPPAYFLECQLRKNEMEGLREKAQICL